MSAYDEVAEVMAREGCSATLTTFPYRGTVLRVTDKRSAVLAYINAGSVEIWPFQGDPRGMPIAWDSYDPQRTTGAAKACELIRTVLSAR